MDLQRKALETALRSITSAVSSRPGIPALTGVVVDSDGARATITGTDLETSASVVVEANGTPVKALIPTKLLAKVVKASNVTRIRIEDDGSHAQVGKVRIRLLPLDDFPKLSPAEGPKITLPLARFAETFLGVERATSGDTARPILTGVKIEAAKGYLTMVATDSYRLHVGTLPYDPYAGDAFGIDHASIVAARGIVAEAKREATRCKRDADATVTLTLGESETAVTFPNGVTIRARSIEGTFPNWQQLMPEGNPDGGTLTYDPAEMVATVKLVSLAAADLNPLRFDLNGSVTLAASSPDLGEAEATVESGRWNGEAPLAFALNPSYLLDALQATGAARIDLRDALKPALIYGEHVRALVMPVRLSAAVA